VIAKNVQADPGGGRVWLQFVPGGYRFTPVRTVVSSRLRDMDWVAARGAVAGLIGVPICVAGRWLAGAAGWDAPKVAVTVLGVLCVVVAVLGLIGIFEDMADLVAYAIVIAVISPMLVFPFVRRRFRTVTEELSGDWSFVPANAVAHGRIGHRGDLVHVTVQFGTGATSVYTAAGTDGATLGYGFGRLLGTRLMA
jgi:hypothetical protein